VNISVSTTENGEDIVYVKKATLYSTTDTAAVFIFSYLINQLIISTVNDVR